MMDQLESVTYWSTRFFNATAAGYFTALFIYIANLAIKKDVVHRAGTITVALAFLTQVTGMGFRWHEAGLVEIEAAERAQHVVLEGAARFVIYTQHPPWSNLYEIMIYMAWGIVLVYLVSEVKFRVRTAGIFALLVALLAMGLASLTPDQTIKPLVPALQSWWIMIHVISSAIG
jgi:ABC-type transport system involved in cytochrome c biogenesis permease subunit